MMVKTELDGRRTEMRQITLFLLVSATVAVLIVGAASAQVTRDFKMTLSSVGPGWNVAFGGEFDGAQMNLCAGQTSLPSGSFICNTVGYWNLESPDGWEPHADCTGGLKAEFNDPELTHVVRFKDGDVMYWFLDTTDWGYACYYPAEDGFVLVNHWQINGGSGRYKGATGSVSWELPMEYIPLGDPTTPTALLGVAHDGVVTGTVTFAP
jgi:hypothetical protein